MEQNQKYLKAVGGGRAALAYLKSKKLEASVKTSCLSPRPQDQNFLAIVDFKTYLSPCSKRENSIGSSRLP